MAKVAGSYASVVGGVSEQVAQSRRGGQVTAQVNMISDPVRGCARRHGSMLLGEGIISGSWETVLADTASSVAETFYVGASEYDIILRKKAGNAATLAYCFNKASNQIVPVVYGSSAAVNSLRTGGASAFVNVGRYIYIAGNTITPTATSTDTYGAASNKRKMVGWVRGGAYARVFKVTLTKTDGTTISGEYKTDYSAYQGILDTSDLDPNASDYQKLVNDRTNAYNSAVTAWIGTASESVTPGNIATKLVEALIAAGVSSSDVSADGAYVVVDSVAYTELDMDDSGDGSLARGVGNVVQTVDEVSSRHFVGKVIKVQPDTDKSAYPIYLKAYAKDEVSTGFAEVVWNEAAGFIWQPQTVFCMGTVEGGTLYIAGSASELQSLTGISEVPSYEATAVGDGASSPLPDLFGKTITCMATFQDRLIIVAGSTVLMSRPGDYLNWFRKSVLSVQDDDPWQGYALGAEDDTIRHWDLFDRNLMLFGDRFQYVLSGKITLTPTNAGVPIATKYKDATEAAPKSSGNFVFYAKHSGAAGSEITSLHQVQPSIVSDVADTYPTSQALDTYLAGRPVEILPMDAPNMVLLRTSKDRNRVFTYSYLDDASAGTRKWDSWSHWQWDDRVGYVCGLSSYGAAILVYLVRKCVASDGSVTVWFACEKFLRDTALSRYPYLDSLRPYSASSGYIATNSDKSDAYLAVEAGHARQLLGSPLATAEVVSAYPEVAAYTWKGYAYPAYVTPTNPFVRDSNGVAIMGGRLTLTFIEAAVKDTGGLSVSVSTATSSAEVAKFTGRILGVSANPIGKHPVVATSIRAPIGREVRECDYTISAVTWLPLTLTAIEWSGQFFYNTRRV